MRRNLPDAQTLAKNRKIGVIITGSIVLLSVVGAVFSTANFLRTKPGLFGAKPYIFPSDQSDQAMAITPFVAICAALCMLVRSARPDFGLWRGILCFCGVFWLGCVLTEMFVLILLPAIHGMIGSINSAGALGLSVGMVFLGTQGVLAIRYGFMPEKGYKIKGIAVLLATMIGPFSWLYIYRKSWYKCCIGIVLGAFLFFVPRLSSLILLIWIWATIDMAVHPSTYFRDYDALKTSA